MLRLANYLLLLITLLALLIIVIPFGISMREIQLMNGNLDFDLLNNPAAKNWNPGAMIPGPIVLMVVSCVLLPLQQMFWNRRIVKDSQFPVDIKWIEKYKHTIWLASFTIIVPFLYFIGIWLASTVSLEAGNNINNLFEAFNKKKYVYIGGIVLTCLLGISTMGYVAYVNIMISYEQQKQLIEEGIKNGTYDPVTRRPIDEVKAVDLKQEKEEKLNADKPQEIDETKPKDDNVSLGSSGLVS